MRLGVKAALIDGQLVHGDVGVPEDPQENGLRAPAPGQTELKVKNEHDEGRIINTG